ncbi:unnamed protein product [Caenorhabditis sp. 36 PRJEB53466]|nr:unnamed protein product [Caenorhabditis sp. 36 PRJEB53466]
MTTDEDANLLVYQPTVGEIILAMLNYTDGEVLSQRIPNVTISELRDVHCGLDAIAKIIITCPRFCTGVRRQSAFWIIWELCGNGMTTSELESTCCPPYTP